MLETLLAIISIPLTISLAYLPELGYKFEPVKVIISPSAKIIGDVRSLWIIGVAEAVYEKVQLPKEHFDCSLTR